VPDPTLITIQPWDVSLVKEIEKAILQSELGLTPANDGKIVRLPIPPLTEERRKQLANVIAPLTSDPRAVLAGLGFDPQRRPETLTPAEFVRLAAALSTGNG
jgi:ribosome recycling factor